MTAATAESQATTSRLFARKAKAPAAARREGPRRFEDPGPVDGRLCYQRGRYRASQLNTLLSRYVQVRGDLLVDWQDGETKREGKAGFNSALVCADFLREARVELESRRANLPVVANFLHLAERMMVSLYPPHLLWLRVHTVRAELEALRPPAEAQVAMLKAAADSKPQPGEAEASREDLDFQRTALKDGLSCIHQREDRDLIEEDLQVRRLNILLLIMFLAWCFLVAAVPFVSGIQSTVDGEIIWPIKPLGHGEYVDLLAGAIGLSIVGAVGGMISGMFGVRDARARQREFRSSIRKLLLKPVVGAIAAVTLYLFLAANVISGVEITNAGTYIVTGFLAGFSERYFLQILNSRTVEEQRSPAGATPATVAGTSA